MLFWIRKRNYFKILTRDVKKLNSFLNKSIQKKSTQFLIGIFTTKYVLYLIIDNFSCRKFTFHLKRYNSILLQQMHKYVQLSQIQKWLPKPKAWNKFKITFGPCKPSQWTVGTFFVVETSNYNYLCTSLDIKNYITSYHLVNFIEMSVLWAPFMKLCTWAFFVGDGKIFM